MSYICCSRNCVHQQEGYCRLEKLNSVSNDDECCHFCKADENLNRTQN